MDAAVAWSGMSFAPTLIIELVARVPHPRLMAGPRAAARAGEIRAGHGGIKSRETSVARNWHRSGLCQFRSSFGGVGDERHKCPNSGGNRRPAAGCIPCLHLRSEFKLMSSYAEAVERRFGDGGPSGD